MNEEIITILGTEFTHDELTYMLIMYVFLWFSLLVATCFIICDLIYKKQVKKEQEKYKETLDEHELYILNKYLEMKPKRKKKEKNK